MRLNQIFLPALIAFATAACARQQASYYAIDPVTRQPVQVVQQATPYAQPQYAQAGYRPQPAQRGLFGSAPTPGYAQASYQQPPAQNSRGLFSSAAPQGYAPAPSPPPYAQPAAPQQPPSGRGLFNTYAQATPVYGQQAYAPPPYGQPAYAPPPVAAYRGPPAPPQYRPPAYSPYATTAQADPFAQARWY